MIYTALNTPENATTFDKVASWIYGGTSVLAIVMLFFNKQIDNAIWKGRLSTTLSNARRTIEEDTELDRLRRKRNRDEIATLAEDQEGH